MGKSVLNSLKSRIKMHRNFVTLYLLLVPLCAVSAESEEEQPLAGLSELSSRDREREDTEALDKAMFNYETKANFAVTAEQKGNSFEDEIQKNYDLMTPALEHIIELMKDSNNVYKFIEAKGIDRIILPYLDIDNTDLRTNLLKLTQLLFDVAPTTTSVMIPIGVLDKLLDIYEDDDSLAIKQSTMDIFYAWLPDNPKVQARIMKLKGLEPFYDQIHKLDSNLIHTELKLFSKILKEHMKIKNEVQQKSKADTMKQFYYNRIGLIETIVSRQFCHGLFNVLESFWSYNADNKEYMVPVFEIIMDIQPYCTDRLFGRTIAVNMLNALHKHVQEMNETGREAYEQLGLNVTELETVLQKYVDSVGSSVKDEL